MNKQEYKRLAKLLLALQRDEVSNWQFGLASNIDYFARTLEEVDQSFDRQLFADQIAGLIHGPG